MPQPDGGDDRPGDGSGASVASEDGEQSEGSSVAVIDEDGQQGDGSGCSGDDSADLEEVPQGVAEAARHVWWDTRRVAAALVLVAIVGFVFGQAASATGLVDVFSRTPERLEAGSMTDASEIAARLDEVAAKMDSNGLYDVDADSATAGTIEALLAATGDGYAEYMDEEYYESYLQYTTGSYLGIGIVIVQLGSQVVVSGVYDDSPADEAGVEVGDVIVSIDGAQGPWTTDSAIEAIEREEGDAIEIVWLRPTSESLDALTSYAMTLESESLDDSDSDEQAGEEPELEGEMLTTEMVYSEITISSMDYEQIDEIGYISIHSFNSNTTEEVQAALEELMADGATSIILDLRGNGGGLLDQAIGVVSLFVEDGDALRLITRDGEESVSVTGESVCDLPLVVLVNGGSASASEIVAAALQDHGRATIVGTTTYGKGTVQTLSSLSFGGAVKYTIAEYRSPDGDIIDGQGVAPDIEVEAADGDLTGDVGSDAQLDAAIEALG